MRVTSRAAGGPAAVSKYLLPNEQQVIHTRRHPAILIGPSLLTLAGLLVAALLSATVLRGYGALITVDLDRLAGAVRLHDLERHQLGG